MSVDRVKFQDRVSSQLPGYVRDDFPLLGEFLEQYYVSQETQGGTLDLLQNIDQYVNIDQLTGLKTSTILFDDIDQVANTIVVGAAGNFTEGFVDRNGLIMIDEEIIMYEYKTDNSFENCHRGFSGITSYISPDTTDKLSYAPETVAVTHDKGAVVKNLNILFLQEFFKKLKSQVSPGFDDRPLKTNQKNFIINSDSFYKSKGTDLSYEILFKALFGETVEIIRPSQFLLKPSSASYSVTEDIVIKPIFGDPFELKNLTLFQESSGARGTVNEVSEIFSDDGNYYQLSIDSGYDRDINVKGTTFGTFVPNPKTKILNEVAIGATVIDVDSTISFPEVGNLEINDIDGSEMSISYSGKTVNQFLNVNNVSNTISEETDVNNDDYAYAYVGIDTSNEVRVRITSTLKDLKLPTGNYFYNAGDTINIKSFGREDDSVVGSKWLVNSKGNYQVYSLSLTDGLENKYIVTTYDNQYLNPGYSIKLTDNTGNVVFATVQGIISKTQFNIKAVSALNVNRLWSFENQSLKGNSTSYSFLNNFISNVQNTYTKFNGEVLVASNSLPYYFDVPLNPYNKTLKFSGSALSNIIDFGTEHGFYTGDAVHYQPGITLTTTTTPNGVVVTTEVESKFDQVEESVYYVKKIDSRRIKLSRSRADLFSNTFVTLTGVVSDVTFTYYSFYQKPIAPQGIYREISTPIREAGDFETLPGFNGMFLNGVELLNYKSDDTIFFGPIEELIVTSPGDKYDVINPPRLLTEDTVGSGATGTVAVEGSLERIDILDTGFDFSEKPIVTISGGNPIRPAKAEVNLTPIPYSINFNSEFKGGNINYQIDGGGEKIGFSTFHKFQHLERVIYDSRGLKAVGGLSTDSSYYVNVVDNYTIKLHVNTKDAEAGINTVGFNTDPGVGTQTLRSAVFKDIVTSVVVTDPGEGYKNKKREIPNAGIITALDQVMITNHGYKTGEVIQYSPGSTAVQGISGGTNYHVTFIDSDHFKLSESKTDLNNKIYVDITGEGNGSFNYEPIVVSVGGVTGISSRNGQTFQCEVQPIFRGHIDSIDMTNQGSSYGSAEIINLNRQPQFSLVNGEGALVNPVVNNGRIVDVIIDNTGANYDSPPELIVSGIGSFAKLTPVLKNGKVVEVKIISPGAGYVTGQTSIQVVNTGEKCQIEAKIKEWNINLFARNNEFVDNDDGYVEENISGESTQYCHLYTPRQLRENTYAVKNNGDIFYGQEDLQKVNGVEVTGQYHSPILGWAYDGNPIYGPNGYSTPEGGIVRQIKSGYETVLNLTHRPPISLYPEGFFIEDFTFANSGDLDVHNGRFCVTPEYPEGVYAYFTSLESSVDASGPFKNYKRPQFPYVIGNTFHSKRIEFNYKTESTQTKYDIQSNDWFRNTRSYNTNNKFSGYDYFFNSNKVKRQTIEVLSSSRGPIQKVGIFTGGSQYQVGDRLVFDNSQVAGQGAQAKVNFVGGKEVDQVSTATTVTPNIEFVKYFGINQFVGFTTEPHGLEDQETVIINGLSDYYKGFDGSYNVGVRSETLVVTLGIGTTGNTGLTTYFYVGGALDFPFIRPNDILGIGTERVKVLNIEKETERIRVLREQDSTVGTSYSVGQVLIGDPRRFNINVGSVKTDKSFRLNEEFYFDPTEAVGVGSTSGGGVGTVVTFKNPGVGATTIFIPTQAVYYRNHGLKLNERIVYSPNGGTTLDVFDGIGSTTLSTYDELFAAPITSNLIGVSSHKVGLATTGGGFVGIGTTTGLMFFTTLGSGDHHSFKTVREDTLRASIEQHTVTVSTASTHGLNKGDRVNVTVKPTSVQTIDVRYNDFNRRVVFNPVGFSSLGIDLILNTIGIPDHNFTDGDKVILTSPSPGGGLVNEAMYYVIPYDKDQIRLVTEKYELSEEKPDFVNITSLGKDGTISRINPIVTTRRNNTLRFDLSDPSLSFLSNGVRYPAFKMKVYLDQEFNKEFVTTGKSEDNSFEVSSSGTVGITTDANVSVKITEDVPKRLYYKFDPVNLDIILQSKRGIVIDKDPSPYNQINVEKSLYDGFQKITSIASTSFTYELRQAPEVSSYDQSDSNTSYITDSKRAYGSISGINLLSGGNGYVNVPKVVTVRSGFGTGAIFEVEGSDVGKVCSHRFDSNNIGFDYPTDETMRPVANLPEILEMESLTSFEFIGISSFGQNYLHPAKLVVVDGYTGKVVPELDLRYKLGDTSVTILNNTTGMYDVTPRIIPTENTNGVGIASLTYDSGTKVVRLYLGQTFNDSREFPYVVGSNILVENVSILPDTNSRGYNSSDYDYTLFPVITAVPQFGGSGAYIEYSLDKLLTGIDVPGTVEPLTTLGQVVSESYFPIFNPRLTTNNFFVGETVTNGDKKGVVESWIPTINQLKIAATKDFDLNTIVRGESSNTQAVITTKYDFDAEITTGVGATVIGGWQNNVGFLNDNLQVLPNNEYYQNFSYSLSSRVPYDTWNDPVSNLNHTSGFAKFADYQLVCEESDVGGALVTPLETNIEFIVDIIGEGDLNCYYDFDFVSEGIQGINGRLASDEIFFENRILTDYFQSIGNRVLSIDDISDQFNSNERAEPFEPIATYENTYIFNKVFTFARDIVFSDERQFSIVNMIQDGIRGYINEYATLESYPRLGFYDYNKEGDGWELTFNPVKFEYNTYNVSSLSFSLLDGVAGTGSTTFGDIVTVESQQVSVPSATTTTVASFSTDNRAAKIMTMVEATSGISSGIYDATEMNIIHDGTTVTQIEYGDIQNDIDGVDTIGLGTYHAYITGSTVNIDFIPSIVGTLESQTSLTLIHDTNTTTGFFDYNVSRVKSTRTAIPASSSPSETVVSTYTNPFSASYNVVLVTDTTRGKYEMFEFVMLNSSSNEQFVEYGNIQSDFSLGQVGMTSTASGYNMTYTPIKHNDIEVKTFAIDLKTFDDNTDPNELDQNNQVIKTNTESYEGTKLDLQTQFGLTHKGNQIFKRDFDGSDSLIVNTTTSAVSLASHFFVTGEEVVYTYAGAGTTAAIGIVTANVPGIGNTDKLPQSLFVVKVDEGNIRFASTAEKALAITPEILEFSSVGYGNSHAITATNQNSKALVAVDNMIQAPITETDITTELTENILFQEIFSVSGITSFASGDILKIDNELMIAEGVGVAGSIAFDVRRAQLGTILASHSSGATVTKFTGNYNIVDNSINFASAPYGNTPLSTTSAARPDERDWTGITTSSSFQGRTFMRRGAVGSTTETYSKNIVFDNISTQFNGITSEFNLEKDGNPTIGFSTDNGIILINNIFQVPEGAQAGDGTYTMTETSGITSIRFTGSGVANGHDPNDSNIPLGGLIESVGSSNGFAYQPLVVADGTANVSTAGTIASISIGNSGSGYRNGVQVVSVGIQQSGGVDLVAIGTATISDGNITDVTVTNSDVFYIPRDVSDVVYTNTTGITTITTSTAHGLTMGDSVKLTGISFTCNYTGSGAVNISNFVYDNVSGIATVTTAAPHNLATTGQKSQVLFTGIAMTCGLDAGASTHVYPRTTDPYYCGSQVTAVNSATEFETNVGVSTVPTFYQSGGTAQPVLITPRATDPAGSSSSVLEVVDSTSFVVNTGISTREHFYARCGTVGRPYDVVFDEPLSYDDIPLQYSSSSSAGIGQSATVSIVVGQGSSVVDFELKNTGYGYGNGEILTVPVGGPSGIPTDPTKTFSEFQITIDKIFTDNFTGYTVGQLQVLDKFDDLFDGFTRDFRLLLNSTSVSIQAAKGSNVEVDQTLLIFINDILQEPGKGYVFTGGSTVEFTEPPKVGDTSKVLFYKGSGDVDVVFTDVLETVKIGDTLDINNLPPGQGIILDEGVRTVTGINTLDSVQTNTYTGVGLSSDRNTIRPVTWCKQTVDKIINGRKVGKDRIKYEPQIYPASYLIQPVGLGSTEAYVDNLRPLFDSNNENQVRDFQKVITLTSQDNVAGASGTATVSAGGTISSITITNSGIGYTVAPSVTIGSTDGVSTIATAEATITSGEVTSVSITNGGVGYTGSQVPVVLFEEPRLSKEEINVSSYQGDYGSIVGFGTTTVTPTGETRLIFDFFINPESYMRDDDYVGTGITVSGISTGDFFTAFNTTIGFGTTGAVLETLAEDNTTIVGQTTSFSDCVFQVAACETRQNNVIGIGTTSIRRVFCNVLGFSTVTFAGTGITFDSQIFTFDSSLVEVYTGGITSSYSFGRYSWGKINFAPRGQVREFNSYNEDGYVGISTAGLVQRSKPLKFNNYVQI